MAANKKAALPVQAGTQGNTASKLHADLTTPTPFNQSHCPERPRQVSPETQLTPRHRRISNALNETPEGILSFTLREICKCQNVADEVMAMRRQGFNITCELEPFITVDGIKSKIGRYRLVSQRGEI